MRLLFPSLLGIALLGNQPLEAQQLDGLAAGARVRAVGEQATNEGIRRFAVRGTLVSTDSVHLLIRRDDPSATVDTIVLFGIRRFDVFQGHRSRSAMVTTGAAIGTVTGVGLWLFARQTVRPTQLTEPVPDKPGTVRTISSPVPTIVHSMRNAIPAFIGLGALVGLVIGDEQWTRVPIPQSVFPQSR